MPRRFLTCLSALLMASTAPLVAQDGDDGLVEVGSRKLDEVRLRPQADFRSYTKVMIDPAEVSFREGWLRDQNRDRLALSTRVTDADAQRILDEARQSFERLFAEAYASEGYELVTAPGPDVLRLSPAIVDLDVIAPDTMPPGRRQTYSREAGEATLVVEAKDSLTGKLLGRTVDERAAPDAGPFIRNRVTNTAEFERIFRRWAEASAGGLSELKSQSPIDPAALPSRRRFQT